MKAFVTGGTGFIGRPLIRKLLKRGYSVSALTRSEQGAADLASLGAETVRGDIFNVSSMREGMRGSDVVFHLAGWYKIGSPDWMTAESLNVGGTRKVMRLARELDIPKVVYTSTHTVLGDTKGELVDETFFQGGPFANEYDRTKWLAHYKVAVPMIEKGAPIIIVMPGTGYGPGDPSLIGDLMRLFYSGRLPAAPAVDFTTSYVHVEDIAEGHIVAAEKGVIGESYILTGPAVPLGEIVDFWSQLTGKPAPVLRIPSGYLLPFAPLMGWLNKTFRLPPLFSREAVELLGMNYTASPEKARSQLGWRTRSLQEGMSETFAYIAETTPVSPAIPERERRIAGAALLATAAFLLFWFIGRRRK
ncbi:MAG: NAD-dependent epimerase/dehydratase family protein [Candidatus Promineifilaceae bacterium]